MRKNVVGHLRSTRSTESDADVCAKHDGRWTSHFRDRDDVIVLFCVVFFLVLQQVAASRNEAEKDNVKVPLTLEDYCIKTKAPVTESTLDMADFYDDDYDLDDDDDDYGEDEDEENNPEDQEEAEDSGNDNS